MMADHVGMRREELKKVEGLDEDKAKEIASVLV